MNAAIHQGRARGRPRDPSSTSRRCGGLLALCALLIPHAAAAQSASVRSDALPGLVGVPTALPAPLFTAAGAMGYGYTGDVLSTVDAHHQVGMSLAAAYSPIPQFAAALRLAGRYDAHQGPGSEGSEGFATTGDLKARARFEPHDDLHVGFELRGLLPPAEDAVHSLSALTPEVSTFGTLVLPRGLFTSLIGFRYNRSDKAFSDDAMLSPYEELALGSSDDPQVLIGLGGGVQLGPVFTFADLRYELAVGSDAPAGRYSPLIISAGARAAIGEYVELGGQVSVSAAPYPPASEVADTPVPPRLWMQLTLAVRLERDDGKAANAPPEPATTAPVEELAQQYPLVGRISGPHGGRLHAQATLQSEGKTREVNLDEDGSFVVDALDEGSWLLRVEAEGYEPVEKRVQMPHSGELRVHLERSLPPGQIQVRVQDFRGRRVNARVVLRDDGREFEPSTDKGTYVLDMPPGEYAIEVFAKGYATEQRSVVVEENGVSIVVIDVRNERKR